MASQPRILEREHELAAVEAALEAARDGDGSLVLVEGPPGIGKSSILAASARSAARSGWRVLQARGTELERGLPFGVVLQVLTHALRPLEQPVRERLLSGPAALVRPLLERGAVGPASPGADPSLALFHGLYWLLADVADEQPTALVVDDLHWADPASVRCLGYLAQRLEGLPLVVVAAAHPALGRDDPVEVLRALPAARRLRPLPLSEVAAARLVRQAYPSAEKAFVTACVAAAGGTPLYLRELLRELPARGLRGTAAEAPAIENVGPASLERRMRAELARHGAAVTRLAQAAAIVGEGGSLRHAALTAGVDRDGLPAATDALLRSGVLDRADTIAFSHPVVRAVLYEAVPAGERAAMHWRVARALRAEAAPAELVASHLLPAQRTGEGWVVAALHEAARSALARGAPEVAAAQLRRALDEGPDAPLKATLLAELGAAMARTGAPEAVDRLREARELLPAPRERAEATLNLAQALSLLGRLPEAVRELARSADALRDDTPELWLRLEAELYSLGTLHADLYPAAVERLLGIGDRLDGSTPAERLVLADLAFVLQQRGATVAEVVRVCELALAGEQLLREATSDSPAFQLAVFAYCMCDRVAGSEALLDAALEDARRRGSAFGFAVSSAQRARARLRRGCVPEAEADAQAAVALVREHGWQAALPVAHARLANALIERGALAAADEVLAEVAAAGDHLERFLWAEVLYHRATLRQAQGADEDALKDLRSLDRFFGSFGIEHPVGMPYRSQTAVVLGRLGERDEARRLLERELELARAYGALRPVGVALRAQGLMEGDAEGTALLEQAVAVLEGCPDRLEHARALVDLGASLRRGRQRRSGRARLREGLELAERCGALALVQRAEDELAASGARRTRLPSSGIDSLTPSERRIAEMAREGLTNRQIAQALFVTVRTIETHLTHAYRKLGIGSRAELAAVLPGPAADRDDRRRRRPGRAELHARR